MKVRAAPSSDALICSHDFVLTRRVPRVLGLALAIDKRSGGVPMVVVALLAHPPPRPASATAWPTRPRVPTRPSTSSWSPAAVPAISVSLLPVSLLPASRLSYPRQHHGGITTAWRRGGPPHAAQRSAARLPSWPGPARRKRAVRRGRISENLEVSGPISQYMLYSSMCLVL